MIEYKAYTPLIEIDLRDNIFIGRIAGIDDLVTFEGYTPEEVAQAFREAVDSYLSMCEKLGDEPQQPRRAAA